MKRIYFLFPIFILLFIFSCRKDLLPEDPSAKLEFSEDTVIFDTVFTSVGSVTKYLKVYNRHKRSIKISSIRIANGSSSNFRMNVNGVPTSNASDIILHEKDSMFIFVEVTVNPNNLANPFIISDSIIFETNGNFQDVDLAAWGQDAHFHAPPPGFSLFALNCNDVWVNDKPHVIYGYAVVYPTCTLQIKEGAKIYFHKNSGLIVMSESSIKVNGTLEKPVIFQGDRLEWSYRNTPGQWDMIWLSNLKEDFTSGPPSKNNEFNYAIIKNGNIGLQVDTNANNFLTPTVKLNNTIIQNMSGLALFGRGSAIEAVNCIFANGGQYSAALVYGGSYSFKHCTFANYWSYEKRDTPLLLLNNYFESNGIIARDLVRADFVNCIIYGANANEVKLDENSGASFQYKFNYCLLKTDIGTTDANHFAGIVLNPTAVTIDGQSHDPVFNNVGEYDFHLFSQSAAVNKGITDSIPLDLDGKTRDSQPDLGALEYIP